MAWLILLPILIFNLVSFPAHLSPLDNALNSFTMGLMLTVLIVTLLELVPDKKEIVGTREYPDGTKISEIITSLKEQVFHEEGCLTNTFTIDDSLKIKLTGSLVESNKIYLDIISVKKRYPWFMLPRKKENEFLLRIPDKTTFKI